MRKNANWTSKLILVIALTGLVTACGGKKPAPVDVDVANTKDITRPPSITLNRAPQETETNPDETISYDEWRRRREAELKAAEVSDEQ